MNTNNSTEKLDERTQKLAQIRERNTTKRMIKTIEKIELLLKPKSRILE